MHFADVGGVREPAGRKHEREMRILLLVLLCVAPAFGFFDLWKPAANLLRKWRKSRFGDRGHNDVESTGELINEGAHVILSYSLFLKVDDHQFVCRSEELT